MAQSKKQKKNNSDKLLLHEIGRGEYQLHVLIQSTTGLSLDSESTVDVKIAVSAFGKTQYTQVKSGIGVEEVYWGEHLYMNKDIASSYEIQNQRIVIAVYDYNKILANSLIGSYEIDLQRIYSENDHTMEHTWLSLSNVDKKFAEITGYVKVSISLLNENDQNVQLEVEPVASITKEKKVLVPPQIERKTYQIVIDLVEGRNLKPADGKTVDSFIGVEFGQIYCVSETILKNCDPSYKTKVFLPMSLPAVIENIAIRLNDFNYIQNTEILGSHYININQLIKAYENYDEEMKKSGVESGFVEKLGFKQFRWVNFYGPQLNTSHDDMKSIQQFSPKLATCYVGSVLMRISISEKSSPKNMKQNLQNEDLKKAKLQTAGPPLFFKLSAKVTAALNLVDKNRKYKISVRVGSAEVINDFVPAKNGFCLWNDLMQLKISLSPMQKMPDIFVYLINDKEQRICFLRYQPKQGQILPQKWAQMNPDLAVIKIQKQQGGYLKLGLNLQRINGGEIREQQRITKMNNSFATSYQTNRKSGRIVIDLLCGQSLIPLDDDGGIDAFFSFSYMQFQVASSVKSGTLNPVYYEKLVIEADILKQLDDYPPIIVNAFDKDTLSNQFLGTTFINLKEAYKNQCVANGEYESVEPYWFELYQNGISSGKFLASFRLLPNYSQSIPKTVSLKTKDFQIYLVIMGLRSLKNSGVFPVKQPFIEFDFAALDISNAGNSFEKNKLIRTEPREKGRNVNITTVIPSKINLPSNYKYWPSISAVVKDNVLGSIYQPIIGYFSVNLQNSYQRSKQIKEQFKKKRQSLNQNKTRIYEKPQKLSAISDNLIVSLRNFVMKCLNYNWEVLDQNVAAKLNRIKDFPNNKINQDYIVVFPNYQKESTGKMRNQDGTVDEKFRFMEKYKDLILKNDEYMQIGVDDKKMRSLGVASRNKHYRFCLQTPYQTYYQQSQGHKLGIMDQLNIRTGRMFTSKDLKTSILRQISQQDTIAGKYKGQLFISEYSEDEKKTKQDKQFKDTSNALLNLMIKKGKIYLYLYVIEAANLPPKDVFGNSDPYLVVRGGTNKVSFEKDYFSDQPNPQFYKKIVMLLNFPDDASIDIEVWDYDIIGGDQLIGKATIDLENRIHAKLTDSRFNNPIQTHNLIHENSKRPQGLIRFWLDLVPIQHKSLYRQFDISPKMAANFEVRVIVWSCHDMPNADIEEVSDLYVSCMFNNQIQSTDVHYRSTTGEGNFNWRMIFPVKLPMKNPMIVFRVFDKDVFNGDDFLSSTSFSLGQYLEEALETCSSVTLLLGEEDLAKESEVPGSKMVMVNGKPMYDRFDYETQNKMKGQQNVSQIGKIRLSIQILTEQQAKSKPVGKGRDVPNQHPYLPNPKGRISLSLNPITMIGQLCGPKFKAKAALIICGLLLLFVIIYGSIAFGGSLAGSAVSIAANRASFTNTTA